MLRAFWNSKGAVFVDKRQIMKQLVLDGWAMIVSALCTCDHVSQRRGGAEGCGAGSTASTSADQLPSADNLNKCGFRPRPLHDLHQCMHGSWLQSISGAREVSNRSGPVLSSTDEVLASSRTTRIPELLVVMS